MLGDIITLWTTTGSEGDIQETVQQATDVVKQHARECDLQCFGKI